MPPDERIRGVFDLSGQTGESDRRTLRITHDSKGGVGLQAKATDIDHADEILSQGLLSIFDRPLMAAQTFIDLGLLSHEKSHLTLRRLFFSKPEVEQ